MGECYYLLPPNIFNKITLKNNYLTQCAGLRLVLILITSANIARSSKNLPPLSFVTVVLFLYEI